MSKNELIGKQTYGHTSTYLSKHTNKMEFIKSIN